MISFNDFINENANVKDSGSISTSVLNKEWEWVVWSNNNSSSSYDTKSMDTLYDYLDTAKATAMLNGSVEINNTVYSLVNNFESLTELLNEYYTSNGSVGTKILPTQIG